MEYGWQWLGSLLASSAGAAVLVGVVSYLGRSQIAHWLAKDLEAIKARHQRELESYRTSLIAEAERTKANQALRTAGAMRILDKKFEAIECLHAASIGLSSYIFSTARADARSRSKERLDELSRRVDAYDTARERIGPFLSVEHRAILFRLKEALHPLIQECFKTEEPQITEDQARALANVAIAAELNVDLLVRAMVNQMGNLDQ